MEGVYYAGGKFEKRVRCWKCGITFYSNRSDAMFCSKSCRLRYYKDERQKMRDIQCLTCDKRSDQHGSCELWIQFKGKTHPRNCKIALEAKE